VRVKVPLGGVRQRPRAEDPDTHDYEDAVALAGTVGVLVDGGLRQLGAPEELVASPRDPFVASFTGANLLHGRTVGHENGLTTVRLESGELLYSTDDADGEVGVVVHPWDISVGRAYLDDSALNLVSGEVSSTPDEDIQICVSAPVGDVVVDL